MNVLEKREPIYIAVFRYPKTEFKFPQLGRMPGTAKELSGLDRQQFPPSYEILVQYSLIRSNSAAQTNSFRLQCKMKVVPIVEPRPNN